MKVKNNFHAEPDYLFIRDFEVPCRVGTTSDERAFPQIVTLSLKLFLPLREAGHSDNLKHSVDYAQIVSDIKAHLQDHKFQLIERVAEMTADIVLKQSDISAVEVKAAKKVFADIQAVGACIYRKASH